MAGRWGRGSVAVAVMLAALPAASCSPPSGGEGARTNGTGGPAVEADAGEAGLLLVRVRVHEAGAELLEAVRLAGRLNPVRGTPPPEPYRLDLLDPAGAVLESASFDLRLERTAAFDNPDGTTEHVRVPLAEAETAVRIAEPPGAHRLRLVRRDAGGDVVLAEALVEELVKVHDARP